MGARKKLIVDEETFFTAALLACGPPSRDAFNYTNASIHPLEQGLRGWLKFDPVGQEFTRCVVNFGEAKIRVERWFYKYKLWWDKHGQPLSAHPLSSGRKIRKV